MSDAMCIEALREAVSPTKVGLIRFDPAAILDAYDAMKQRAEAAEADTLGCAMECSKAVDRAMKAEAERAVIAAAKAWAEDYWWDGGQSLLEAVAALRALEEDA
jgi:hypothetical protein